jgi:hypothetical protein
VLIHSLNMCVRCLLLVLLLLAGRPLAAVAAARVCRGHGQQR